MHLFKHAPLEDDIINPGLDNDALLLPGLELDLELRAFRRAEGELHLHACWDFDGQVGAAIPADLMESCTWNHAPELFLVRLGVFRGGLRPAAGAREGDEGRACHLEALHAYYSTAQHTDAACAGGFQSEGV